MLFGEAYLNKLILAEGLGDDSPYIIEAVLNISKDEWAQQKEQMNQYLQELAASNTNSQENENQEENNNNNNAPLVYISQFETCLTFPLKENPFEKDRGLCGRRMIEYIQRHAKQMINRLQTVASIGIVIYKDIK
jgi:CMP-2-keto-3-deoxyoctulosonic acid synthetase